VRLLLVMVGVLGLVVSACDGGDEGDSRQAGPTIASNGAPTTVGRPTTSPSVSATSTTSTSVTSTAAPTSVEPGSTDAHGAYSSVDLGVLPGTSMAYALDINDDGVVVGVGFLPVDGEASPVAVWWPDLTSGPQRLDIDLGLDQRSGSRALRVNNRGQILVSGGGELILIDPASGSTQEVLVPFAERPIVLFEAGLNNAGDVVGSVVVDEVDTGEGVYAVTHAFKWSAATLQAADLGTIPGTESSHAYDINDAGQIVGDSDGLPFVWDPAIGVMTALDIPVNPGEISLMRINNAGLILGSPAVWDLRADALVSTGQGIVAYDLNDAGLVAAILADSCPACEGMTWDPFTGATTVLEPAAFNPLAINNNGDVVGTSNARATLWTPKPQP
jgi:hypothetical protein